MAEKRRYRNGIVYSTDPGFNFSESKNNGEIHFQSKEEQRILIRLDKKHRAGKIVTLIEGLGNTEEETNTLGKEIKKLCGTGGSVKNSEIIIQGDFRQKILQWLKKNGYRNATSV